MATVTGTIAEWASRLQYDELPTEVVREAKRFVMDSVGCALGGAQQHDVAIAREVLAEIAGAGPCRVMVTGELWDPVSASLLNALMIRVMDYNDIYWKQDPSHPSDLIPAAIATAERSGCSGRDLIVGIALAYEIEQRLCEVSFPGIREIGWHHATLTAAAAGAISLGMEHCPKRPSRLYVMGGTGEATRHVEYYFPKLLRRGREERLHRQVHVLVEYIEQRGPVKELAHRRAVRQRQVLRHDHLAGRQLGHLLLVGLIAEHADQPVTPVKQETIANWRETASRTRGAEG